MEQRGCGEDPAEAGIRHPDPARQPPLPAGGHRRTVADHEEIAVTIEQKLQAVSSCGPPLGHGAGLCQWGAKVLADQGRDFKQILAHYYPGTELQVLY